MTSLCRGANVLVIDDERLVRDLIRTTLETAGYAVTLAADGAEGLERIRCGRPPDLVLCDVITPRLDGFRVLQQVRADPATTRIVFVLVSGISDRLLDDRAAQLGADAVLRKPFAARALLALVERLSLRERGAQAVMSSPAPTSTDPSHDARCSTVAPARAQRANVLLRYTLPDTKAGASALRPAASKLLAAWHARLCEPLLQEGGVIAHVEGHEVTALFTERGECAMAPSVRAIRAALALMVEADDMRGTVEDRYIGSGLPRMTPRVGLHAGPAEATEERVGGKARICIRGRAERELATLCARLQRMDWSIAATEVVVRATGCGAVVTGQRTKLSANQNNPGMLEVKGMDEATLAAGPMRHTAERVRSAIRTNSRMIAMSAVRSAQDVCPVFRTRSGQRPIAIDGYRLLKKLGQGAYAQAFLAESLERPALLVLKVLDAPMDQHDVAMQQFIEEYALASQIAHPNVARIHAQGFTEDCAFIAMEYFPKRDLERAIARKLSELDAASILAQIASGLGAIHAAGIVHRDIKPSNVMMRADGSIAIADFGIARQHELAHSLSLSGKIVGTPYYLSPEQALGEPATRRSDLYSVGVLYYFMLTRERPYMAESAMAVLEMHVNAPIPILPAPLERHQWIVNRLMAKRPQERFASAAELYDHACVLRESLAKGSSPVVEAA